MEPHGCSSRATPFDLIINVLEWGATARLLVAAAAKT
jgi:hypothetical protein